MPLFVLPSTEGRPTGPGDMRSKYNLVLLFVNAGEPGEAYLRELVALHPDIVSEQARVLAVLPLTPDEIAGLKQELDLPFTLLADEGGETTHRMFGEVNRAALCVADRFGEIYSLEAASTAGYLPPAETALDWLLFIMVQCPE